MLVAPDGTTIAAWLWQRPAPHDLAIVPGKPGGFHHAAFVVDTPDALFRAADILAMNKARIDYGPGRHGITRGTTIYFFDPSGNRLEAFGGTARTRWIRIVGRSAGRRTRWGPPSSITRRS